MPLTRINSSIILDGAVASADLESNMVLTGTESITLPKGTTAQRGSAVDGKFRFNTTLNQFEG